MVVPPNRSRDLTRNRSLRAGYDAAIGRLTRLDGRPARARFAGGALAWALLFGLIGTLLPLLAPGPTVGRTANWLGHPESLETVAQLLAVNAPALLSGMAVAFFLAARSEDPPTRLDRLYLWLVPAVYVPVCVFNFTPIMHSAMEQYGLSKLALASCLVHGPIELAAFAVTPAAAIYAINGRFAPRWRALVIGAALGVVLLVTAAVLETWVTPARIQAQSLRY